MRVGGSSNNLRYVYRLSKLYVNISVRVSLFRRDVLRDDYANRLRLPESF